jgi:hypothetical protein
MTTLDASTSDDQLARAYRGWGFDRLPDRALVHDVARAVSRPRRDPADSFVLHAPLELTARFALLPYVAPDHRDAARLRIFSMADRFDGFGPAVDEPDPTTFRSPAEGSQVLAEAIEDGDLDAVDSAAQWLGAHVDGRALRALLTDAVVPRLSAAAHGSILLYQLPRIAPRGELPTELLRPLARELARYPDWRLTWMDSSPRAQRADPQPGDTLFDALAATPHLGVPGSDFIFPLMSQAEERGVAEDVLRDATAGVDLADGARAILRAAAWSMLREPDTYVPYGWTHCLTLPQAVLGIAASHHDPRAALAVAATYVVGFRAAFATDELDVGFDEPPPELGAASVASDVVTDLATRAATHTDAHFVKYTLACIDAAHFDPSRAGLYLAAASRLATYWSTR